MELMQKPIDCKPKPSTRALLKAEWTYIFIYLHFYERKNQITSGWNKVYLVELPRPEYLHTMQWTPRW